ncbi:MAG TPA: EI24 domain-containing protein [Burkholderiaceae bacterium]
MHSVFVSFGRALYSQFHFRMLMLTFMPFALSVVIWGVVLWLGLNPMIDWIRGVFADNNWFAASSSTLNWLGLGALKTVIVPLIAMWLLLPLMILTALLLTSLLAMPLIIKHVASRHYPELHERKGGTIWRSIWMSASSFIVFVVMWVIALPLSMIPPLGFIVQPILWGWLTYRVMAFEALSEHADGDEIKTIIHQHRWPLLLIGIATGALGTAPMLIWMGGVLAVVFFPILAGLSIWLYLVVFIFTGLWFVHYCLAALAKYRSIGIAEVSASATLPSSQLKDIN